MQNSLNRLMGLGGGGQMVVCFIIVFVFLLSICELNIVYGSDEHTLSLKKWH